MDLSDLYSLDRKPPHPTIPLSYVFNYSTPQMTALVVLSLPPSYPDTQTSIRFLATRGLQGAVRIRLLNDTTPGPDLEA